MQNKKEKCICQIGKTNYKTRIHIVGHTFYVDVEDFLCNFNFDINYCPFCGRNLKKEENNNAK